MKLCTRCERAAKGLCRCGEPRAEGRAQCAACLEDARLVTRDARARRVERDERKRRHAEQDAALEAILERRAQAGAA